MNVFFLFILHLVPSGEAQVDKMAQDHDSGMDRGHYWCVVRKEALRDKVDSVRFSRFSQEWLRFDDHNPIRELSEQPKLNPGDQPYILFYTKA